MPDRTLTRLSIYFVMVIATISSVAVGGESEQRPASGPADKSAAGVEFFEKKVRPVLVQHCDRCHSGSAKALKGGLRLDLKSGWQKGGDSGEPAIVPGKPDQSLLMLAVRHDDNASAMPPDRPKLADEVIADLASWIQMGAPDPRTGELASGKQSWEAEYQNRLDWWSLKPVEDVPAPDSKSDAWSAGSVDRFIHRALREKNLQPASEADALTLLRRLSFVLTGLPPSSHEVRTFPQAFASEPETALESAIDRLLDSPHFGERLARHWMDVVRYTDTYGYEWDNPAKGSWEYRDYLIRAFNNDVGFDQLIREQIAGDLLKTPRIDDTSGFTESLIGPMFYHMGEHRHGDNTAINGVREEMIDNKIDAFSKAFLATTVACARCHDHKLDAISQADYYALAGVFMTPRWTSRSIDAPSRTASIINELKRLRDAIQTRTGRLWSLQVEQLSNGEVIYNWAIANRAELTKAKLGDVEWLLNSLLSPESEALQESQSKEVNNGAANAWKQAADQWRTASESRSKANEAKFKTLAGLESSTLPDGWVTDGTGIRTGWADGGEPLIALDGDSAVRQLLSRGWHTHSLSSKLAGAVRLPHQKRVPGKYVSLKLAGGEWSGYLRLSDNGFQTETVTFLDQPKPAWKTFADSGYPNGIQTVAYEIATSDLNPNFPPRTGVARVGSKRLPDNDDGFDKRSWFSITGIVTHDQPGVPADEMSQFAGLFAGRTPDSLNEVFRRIGSWLATSVSRCVDDSQTPTDSDVRLVNWLLAADLLPNSLQDDAELASLVTEYRNVEQTLPYPRTANGMDERDVLPVDYALNVRGDIDVRGDRIARSLPRVFAKYSRLKVPSGESGRRQLAEFLTDVRHGLAARVYVNRVWQWVFGEGLVRTPNDFGHLGDTPSHPQLLDHLTRHFIADGWSTKRLLKRLLLTSTLRQSGETSLKAVELDPGNRLLHHYPTRRLEAEAIRDSVLAVSGRLDAQLFGRPINPRRHVEDAKKRLFSGPLDGNGRRSIYLEVSIMDRSKFLQSFNAPDPKLPTGRRDVTSVPAQALVMLNDPFVIAMADHWAGTLVEDDSPSVEARIEVMFIKALGRSPSETEVKRWSTLPRGLAKSGDVLKDREAWQHTAHTLFNLQEFLHYR